MGPNRRDEKQMPRRDPSGHVRGRIWGRISNNGEMAYTIVPRRRSRHAIYWAGRGDIATRGAEGRTSLVLSFRERHVHSSYRVARCGISLSFSAFEQSEVRVTSSEVEEANYGCFQDLYFNTPATLEPRKHADFWSERAPPYTNRSGPGV